jgi:enoyl-CoA hydratase
MIAPGARTSADCTAGDACNDDARSAVEVLVDDAVAVLTINRPSVRNAIDYDTAALIAAAVDQIDGRADVRACVITGGGSTFCAGMDLKSFANGGRRPVIPGRGFAGIVERPPQKPTIAAIEGHAIGGGCEIALACDIIVAGRGALFGLPEVKRGLTAAGGGLFRLPRRIPYHAAMQLVLTGDPITATRAGELGLATVVDDGQARSAATTIARTIAANGPLAVAISKRVLIESLDWPEDECFARQEPLVDTVRRSADASEGARAFAEKRAPVWRDLAIPAHDWYGL